MLLSNHLAKVSFLRWRAILCLLLMLVSMNSAVFFGGRMLLPLSSSLTPQYKGPLADGATTMLYRCDPRQSEQDWTEVSPFSHLPTEQALRQSGEERR